MDNSAFEGALERFSQFFIEPLLDASGINKELHAVHQEYASNIEDESGNVTRFLVMGKNTHHPELLKDKKYITSVIFKVRSKPAALYSALSGFAINQVNLSKLESFPEKNSFANFSFFCDCEGHIEEPRIKAALEELGLHCKSLAIIGVYEASSFRQL